MNIFIRKAIVPISVIVVATAGTLPAAARPDAGVPLRAPATSSVQDSLHCPLERVGTQFVRCDNLTGAGVPAHEWVPEYRSAANDAP
ncbi:hypothetical protein [Aeromicrobium wangtongii]|uniref:Secreted protein n=1 Tax=Aeromicrobium wangtongii TaxID=2969247 RepID=A0ABY5MFA1_9ACTN|nr:hypothetical protein [Aeromicrobium wangtongii]MCD9197925.1 hypothetical protein [Aeromicrobium wangtongii]UUP15403.1 hypothetical protein NQV15_08845 [Aeromicrobium wangtongii]